MSEHSNIHREPRPLLTKGESLRIEGAERPPSGGEKNSLHKASMKHWKN